MNGGKKKNLQRTPEKHTDIDVAREAKTDTQRRKKKTKKKQS